MIAINLTINRKMFQLPCGLNESELPNKRRHTLQK